MYKKYRFKDSDVHIYVQEQGEELKLIQSDNSKPLSRFWNDDFKCLINCSYFTRDYVLGRNQGILKNDRPALDDIIDLVIKKDNSYIVKDLNEWDWVDSQCGFSVAAVLIKDFKDVKEISTAIVGESKLTAINPQTAIARVDGKWAFIVVDGRSHQSRGINGYDLRDFIKANFEKVELLALLDGGGSSQMMMGGFSKNRPSDGVERFMFNGLAFFKKNDEVKK